MTVSRVMAELAAFVAGGAARELPPEVEHRTALHTLDTVAAMVSGADLDAGVYGARLAARIGGPGHSSLISGGRTDPITAALANGFAAHADETDDSHPPSTTHPGCAIVPAALALAQDRGVDGRTLLRAVSTGYDVGTRVVLALRFRDFTSGAASFSTHAIGGVFGAAAAGAVALGLDEAGVRAAFALAAQSASGITTWLRDPNHIEKAFVFGGMPASNGARAALMADLGLRGVEDVFDTGSNVLSAFSADPDPAELVAGLGTRFEVTRTAIKKYAVGSPAQAAVQAMVDLVEGGLRAADVAEIEIVLPQELADVVDGREMPVINVQYLVSGVLLDGGFSFAMAHDHARMSDPAIRDLIGRTTLTPHPVLVRERVATLRVTRRDGSIVEHTCEGVRGGPSDPMTTDEVAAKAVDLMSGRSTADELVTMLLDAASIADTAALHSLLTPLDREDPSR